MSSNSGAFQSEAAASFSEQPVCRTDIAVPGEPIDTRVRLQCKIKYGGPWTPVVTWTSMRKRRLKVRLEHPDRAFRDFVTIKSGRAVVFRPWYKDGHLAYEALSESNIDWPNQYACLSSLWSMTKYLLQSQFYYDRPLFKKPMRHACTVSLDLSGCLWSRSSTTDAPSRGYYNIIHRDSSREIPNDRD